jgi:hypothetical protein
MKVGIQAHVLAAMLQGKTLDTRFVEGWVGLRADLDRCGKFRPHRGSIPSPSSPKRVVIP